MVFWPEFVEHGAGVFEEVSWELSCRSHDVVEGLQAHR